MMENDNFLPSPEDWNKWFQLEKQFDLYDLINPQILSVLLCCIEYHVVQRRPPTLEELYEHINETSKFFFPTQKSLNSKKASTRSLLLRNLEEKKIISIITVQEWRKKNKLDEKINGKTVFYTLTEKGIILYELILNFPIYSFLLTPNWQENISLSHLSLSRGISSRKERIYYSEEYFIKNNVEIKGFDSELFKNTEKFLKDFKLNFWKMCNQTTYLLRERSLLKYITYYCYLYVRIVRTGPEPSSKIASNLEFGHKFNITNYKTATYEEIRMFGANYYTYTLVPKMKSLSYDESIFETNSPFVPKDVAQFVNIDYLSGYLYFNEFGKISNK